MKKIKKLLCIMLAAFLLASVGTVVAGAKEPVQPDMEALQQKFIAYLDEQGVAHKFEEEETSEVQLITVTNNWYVFYGTPGWLHPTCVSDRVRNYILVNSSWEHPYKLGIYAEKNGEILTLNDANRTGEIILNDTIINTILEQISSIRVYSPGDTDMDGDVTVKDVLNVQKIIAKLIAADEFTFVFYDYNNDGDINVCDVLDIQMKIAKIL